MKPILSCAIIRTLSSFNSNLSFILIASSEHFGIARGVLDGVLGAVGGASGKGLEDLVGKSVKIPREKNKHVYSLYHVTNQLQDYMYNKGNFMLLFFFILL